MPHDIPQKSESFSHSWARESDILEVVQIKDDLQEFVRNQCQNANCQVLRCILGIKSQLGNTLLKLLLVLDDSLLELGKVPMVRALDWLIQAYIVFNLQYPFGVVKYSSHASNCIHECVLIKR